MVGVVPPPVFEIGGYTDVNSFALMPLLLRCHRCFRFSPGFITPPGVPVEFGGETTEVTHKPSPREGADDDGRELGGGEGVAGH